ncbi:unnamed protein product (macronuclear) [Paramecium tetraurelia]|uniref:Transmembrane protein n=1 Tax=Paramecium tetraurelia TaxID=5888 RepID=A0EBW6_PARTE|nr:uncharacterized protein GSPATT00025518001 [Paramecium tetraurelia]CAK92783.1 unnamed protein product [Paramecium tetraurelia]|eukprot:XP_001460180.1 hypothetical protein (macronuclear) [Paramecium tetraurelia strain d4-2]
MNIKFVNLNIIDSTIFEVIPFARESEFIISKFIFENCTFTNTTIFKFKNNIKVTILDLIVVNCKFLNSQFAFFQFDLTLQSNVNIQFLIIKNSDFQQSYIIKNADSLKLNNVSLLQNTFLFTQIIEFRNSLIIHDILIQGNTLVQSQIIIKISTTQVESSVIIDQLVFEENYNTNSSIFITDFSVQNGLDIYLMNLHLNQNQQIQEESFSTYLFDINCLNLSIHNFLTRNSDYFNYFNLIAITNIKVYNIIFQRPQLKTKVPLYLDCIESMNLNSQLFYVQGFNYLELVSITIMNYKSIDQSFISIFSNILKTMKDNEIISISDLKFIGNTLLKINLRSIFSLMSIYSEKSQQITINNIQFEENIYHQYIDDSSQNTASLLFINSQQSSVIVSNLSCQLNVLTNSTSSYILIKSKMISLSKFTIQNHNILNTKILFSLFDFELKNALNQNQINQILQRILRIQNKEGVLYLTAEYCSISTGTLQNILSLNSQLFNIHTLGIGIIKIDNINIISIESLDLQNSESDGCFAISSQNSLLQLELLNIYLMDVQNTFASPIIFIQPSKNKNSISIRNITATNCFSLMNLLLKTEFPSMNLKNNKVLIENVKITQNKLDLFQYLQKFNSLSSIDMQRVLNDNGVIIVYGCILTVRKFVFEGVLQSSILRVGDAFRVNIEKIHLNQISMVLKGNLIHIVQSSYTECVVRMQDVVFSNITIIESFEFKNLSSSQNIIELVDSKCGLINDIRISIFYGSDIGFEQFFDQLISESNQQGSLIYFQSQSNPIKIVLSSISATYVRASSIFNAILYFDLSSLSSIDIRDFNCFWNNLNRYGCIFAQSNDKQNSNIRLENSIFYSNKGGFGTGIYTKNGRVVVHNSKIMKNQAEVQGGGLNLQLKKNEFLIKNTFIQENQANEAGGIYLNGDMNLNNQNFINSILLFNKAKIITLELIGKMFSIQKVYEKILINFLNIDPYYIIEQGKIIQAKVLVLPSNQVIKKYLLFNPNNQKFQKYIYEFSVIFKNSLNEQVISFTNSTCVIKEQILSEDRLELSKNPQMTSFKTTYGNFDLSELQFSFDPYMENNKQQQILIICQPNNTFAELYYNIKIATLKCQLGEFYMSNSCQPCQSNQGYYSVTYNTTKCSIFDKNKFENITSNQINLKVGYWRPNQFSDNIESCFKYPNICRGGWFVGDQLCLSGYLGGLCEECDKYNIRGHGYYFINQYSMLCYQCDQPSNRILLFIVASIWQLASTLLTLSSIEKSNKQFILCKLRQKFSNIIFKLNLDHGSIIIKLFLNYLWIFSAIFSFNISFTFSFNFIDQTSNPSYFMANNLDCFLSKMNDIQLIYLRIITMFILMLCILLFIYIGFMIIELIYKKQFDASILSITALYLYVSNYASLIKQFFSLLAKRQISDINYIQGDVSLIFGTPNHIKWILSFVIPGLGLIGWLLPFTLLILLYVKRHQIESVKFRKHFCYLFNEYNKENFFWEWVKLAQKTFVIVILTYFETNIYLKASLLGLCLLLYQQYALEQQPYIIFPFNKLDVKTGQICSISIFLAVIKYICEQQDNYTTSFIIQMMLVFLCIRLSFPFFKSLITLYHKKYKKQILLQLLNLTKILRCTSCIDRYLRNKLILWNQKEQRIKSIFYKLRHHLIYISKLQLEQQKQNQKSNRSLTSFIPPESLPRYKQLKACISSSQL